ncbi:MAG: aminoacyl-tRNA hydrolase [Bacteroidales bacterium]|nr:aminoacyl-tRNA hydrolase [Candidatus Cryptobacteroides equifaecalis]
MSDKSFLIAGLGNIGPEYASTRHNIGFMILDAWAQASNVVFSTERYGDVAVVKEKGREYHLLKPSTYMNLSGNAVRYWKQKLDIPLENILVICDDINLPFGTTRLRKSGSAGGHNGLKNITELLETKDFARLRCGVGHDFQQGAQVDFVLGKFDPQQIEEISLMSKKIVQGVKTMAFMGIDKAMNMINAKPKQEEKV